MASKGYIEQLLNALGKDVRGPIVRSFQYVLDNGRFGLQTDRTRAENFQGYRFDATTPGTANEEFSIAHNLGYAPGLILPILPLEEGTQLVPLVVTKAPDEARVYLRSSSTGAPISVYVE